MFSEKNSLGIGIGLRPEHYSEILTNPPKIDWFEALTENYLFSAGRPLEVLEHIARDYPIALHGVSMSIGSTATLDYRYLHAVKELAKKVNAKLITDHLCWTGVADRNMHDLLPVPYDESTLHHVVGRIREVQDYLGCRILLENPSTYLEFNRSTMKEWEFIAEMANMADCGLLLDLNNVYVSSVNHGFNAKTFIDAMPAHRVGQYHIAGHSLREGYLLDSHIGPVPDPVWDLLTYAHKKIGGRSTLMEWDAEIPELQVVVDDAQKATAILGAEKSENLAKVSNF